MAIKISGTTVIDDSRNLVNINTGLGVGVNSNGTSVGTGVTILNFVGSATTMSLHDGTLNISAGGGGGGALGISSNSFTSFVGTAVTHLNIIGAGITAVGLTTMAITIDRTLTVGRRTGAVVLNLIGSGLELGLQDGSTVIVQS
jgi:hypothetical protein|tara:strand:- start:53 stop:484 length:432 start_codon:yes stop_codon:yes gene_type:complete